MLRNKICLLLSCCFITVMAWTSAAEPITLRMTGLSGNYLGPGGCNAQALRYVFSYGDASATGSFLGCCGLFSGFETPQLTQEVDVDRSVPLKIALTVPGELCDPIYPFGHIWYKSSCIEFYYTLVSPPSMSIFNDTANRPNQVEWQIHARRTDQSFPVAKWEIVDTKGESVEQVPENSRYKLTADGVSRAIASIINTSETPTFEFSGEDYGCTLTPEGILTAGTNLGTVKVTAVLTNESECLERDFYFDLVEGCGDCESGDCEIGETDANNGSVDVRINLGRPYAVGTSPFLQIKAETPSVALGTPELLLCNFSNPDMEKITNSSGWVRQVRTYTGYVDVLTNSSSSYALHIYSRANMLNKTNDLYTFSGAPLRTITVELVNGDTNHVRIASNPGQISEYFWETNGWALVTGNGMRRDTKLFSLSNDVRTEIRTIKNGAGIVERETVQKWQVTTNGDRLIEEVFGAGSGSRTNQYQYTAEGMLQQALRWDGSWDIYSYDYLGRQTHHYTGFNDAAPTTNASLCRLTTKIYTNSVVQGSGDNWQFDPFTARMEVDYLLGVEIGRRYKVIKTNETRVIECINPGSDWNNTNNSVTVTYYHNDSFRFRKPSKSVFPNGTIQLFTYSWDDFAPDADYTTILSGAPNGSGDNLVRGTRQEIRTSPASNRTITEHTYDFQTGFLLNGTSYEYDSKLRLTNTVFFDGTSERRIYNCCELEASIDRQGTETMYAHDLLGRVITTTRDGVTISNHLNAAGDLLATYRIGTNGSTIRLSASKFDTTGRLLVSTNALEQVTSYSESFDGLGRLIKTQTNPDTSTRVETFARDGTLLSLSGTGVLGARFTNGIVNFDGFDRVFSQEIRAQTNGADSMEWERLIQDSLGRNIATVFPDGGEQRSYYNSAGQLIKTVDPDGVASLYTYNNLGEVHYSAIDANTNGVLDLVGVDRVSVRFADVITNSSWGISARRESVSQLIWTNSSGSYLMSEHITSVDGRRSLDISWGRTNVTQTELLGNGASRKTFTAPDGTLTIQLLQSGRLISQTVTNPTEGLLQQEEYHYDAHNRRTTVIDLRSGVTSLGYDDLDRTLAITNPPASSGENSQVTMFVYDEAGRVTRTQRPDGSWTTNEFLLNGLSRKISGSGVYPVEFTYDYAGRKKTMTTQQNASTAATTTWHYDGFRGFLTNKSYMDGQGPDYVYSKGGRLLARTWARGTNTVYGYNGAGEIESIDYSDNTADVVYTYDRRGKITKVTGTTTNDYEFSSIGLPMSEIVENRSWRYRSENYFSHDSRWRRDEFENRTLGIVVNYSYDGASRLRSVSEGESMVRYGYSEHPYLVGQILFTNSNALRMVATNTYDNLGRLLNTESRNGLGTPLTQFKYGYNELNQRTAVTNLAQARWAFGYDELGQLTNGWRHWADGQRVKGQTFDYSFDSIGNRTKTAVGGDEFGNNLRTANYTVNLLNQYTERDVPGFIEVAGSSSTDATVSVNGSAAARQDEYYRSEIQVDNTAGAVVQRITNVAASASATSVVSRVSYLPKDAEEFAYDADGNLLEDGLWRYSWDAENRLVQIETQTNAVLDSDHWKRIVNDYDYQSRRIRKRVYGWDASVDEYRLLNSILFFYDGWNLVGQVDEITGLRLSFIWGNDLSGSMQGAGGVGGLLAMKVQNGRLPGVYFCNYLVNGSIVGLVNGDTEEVVANYEYGPFGEPIAATGELARVNPFRFSTKYTDHETDLIYYGYRYYNPSTGTWLNRDPLEEDGGLNLYGFVRNDGVNTYDYLGLAYGEHLTRKEAQQLACVINRWLLLAAMGNALIKWGDDDRSLTLKFLARYMSKRGGVLDLPYYLIRNEELIQWGNANALEILQQPGKVNLYDSKKHFEGDLRTSLGRVLLRYTRVNSGQINGEIIDRYTFSDTKPEEKYMSAPFPLLELEAGPCCWPKDKTSIRDYWMWDLERFGFAKSFITRIKWIVRNSDTTPVNPGTIYEPTGF